jgi:hypothetical protein
MDDLSLRSPEGKPVTPTAAMPRDHLMESTTTGAQLAPPGGVCRQAQHGVNGSLTASPP